VTRRPLALVLFAVAGCSHTQLSGEDLDRVHRPAYVGRVSDGAGPKAQGPNEAQQVTSMNSAIGRFEMSERLRTQVAGGLRGEKPWSNAVPAAQVASALELFLVERVPPVPPDYARLKPLGADAVVELVIEDYGVQPEGSGSRTYVKGYGRMFLLSDGSELWRAPFDRSSAGAGLPALDASALASDPGPYGAQMRALLDGAARALVSELTPPGRMGGAPTPAGSRELAAPADAPTKTEQEIQKSRPPAPDLTAPAETPAPTDRSRAPAPPTPQPHPDLTAPTAEPVTPKQP
jgi:hypothetical protein